MVDARFRFGYWKVAKPGPQSAPYSSKAFRLRYLNQRALAGELRRDVRSGRQVPGLRVPVALLADADGAVHVGDHGHRAGVRSRGLDEARPGVASRETAGRVGPVQRRVHRQQVRPELAAGVLEVVDPLDPHRPARLCLDGQRRRVVQQQPPVAGGFDGAVAPHGGGRKAVRPGRQDLLLELLHRDLVVVGVLAALQHDRPGLRHHRRDEQGCHVLAKRGDIDGASRDGGLRHLGEAAELGAHVQAQEPPTTDLQELSSR